MEEELIKKDLPKSIEAERSVIGSMMMDPEAIVAVSEILTPEDFYQKQLGVIYGTMVELFSEGKAVDLVTLQDRLKTKDIPPEYLEVSFLSEMVMAVPVSTNAAYYAGIVREKSVMRNLIRTAEGIANNCYLGKESLDEILEKSEKAIFEISGKRSNTGFESISKIVVDTITSIEMAAKNKGSVTGIASGFIDVDYKTAGFQNSDLILIAARPSMGKTAFVLNLAEYIAVRSKQCTAVFSLEMSKDQLVKRLLSMNSHVDSQAIRTGSLSEEQWEMLFEGGRAIAESKLILDDTPGITVRELRSKCRKYKLEHDLKLIIIDYLQLMNGSSKSESRQQEVAEISRSLKALARELNVPIIALSQLSRQLESRPDKRPMLSDLRESGAIEQDADVVMFIYRDEYYNKESEDKGIAEIIIGKQRNGPTGTVKLKWQAELTRFANLANQR